MRAGQRGISETPTASSCDRSISRQCFRCCCFLCFVSVAEWPHEASRRGRGWLGMGSRDLARSFSGTSKHVLRIWTGSRQGGFAPKLLKVICQYSSHLVSIRRAQLEIEQCKKLIIQVYYRKSKMLYSHKQKQYSSYFSK